MFQIIVIGGGPAGMTAALYGLRNGKRVAVIEKSVFGGQITNSPKVENIPGFLSVSGDEFADTFLDQILEQGATVMLEEATDVEQTGEGFVVHLASGETVEGETVILATGTRHRLFGFEGEEELIGNGISFCAVCDGDFYTDRTVCLIGGGNSAFVEGILLANVVKKLIILQDMPFFTAEARMQDTLLSNPKVEAHVGTKVQGYVTENGEMKGVRYIDSEGREQIAACDGVFLAIGLVPDNQAYAGLADLDERGYFAADESCLTKTPGVFVAGDCRKRTLRQVVTACSDGATAAIAACEYLTGR